MKTLLIILEIAINCNAPSTWEHLILSKLHILKPKSHRALKVLKKSVTIVPSGKIWTYQCKQNKFLMKPKPSCSMTPPGRMRYGVRKAQENDIDRAHYTQMYISEFIQIFYYSMASVQRSVFLAFWNCFIGSTERRAETFACLE